MRRRGSLAFAVAAFAITFPATSTADFDQRTANGITYINDQVPVGGGQSAVVSSGCPPAGHLIGAAAEVHDSTSAGILASLRPDDGDDPGGARDDGVTAFTHNTTNISAGVHVWAFCAGGKTRYPSRTRTLQLGDTKTLKARCPVETRVLSGGFYLDGLNSEIHLQALRPFDNADNNSKPDDGWKVRASNLAGSDKLYMAWAFCRADVKPVYLREDEVVNAGDVEFTSLSCPNQARSVAGIGGEIRGAPELRRLSGLQPADDTTQGEPDTVPDDRAFLEVDNPSASQATYVIDLICADL
jgi:hypothetical protein